jgi:predicted RNase H-like HicB family nuclease
MTASRSPANTLKSLFSFALKQPKEFFWLLRFTGAVIAEYAKGAGEPDAQPVSVRLAVEPDDDKTFHAYIVEMPGLHASGSTIFEALYRAFRLVPLYLASLSEHGDPLPLASEQPERIVMEPSTNVRTETIWTTRTLSGAS